jgi:hypothetical protein
MLFLSSPKGVGIAPTIEQLVVNEAPPHRCPSSIFGLGQTSRTQGIGSLTFDTLQMVINNFQYLLDTQ